MPNNVIIDTRIPNVYRGIVYINSTYIEYGLFILDQYSIPIYIENRACVIYLNNIENCKVQIYWSNRNGFYSLNKQAKNNIKTSSKRVNHYPIGLNYNFSKLTFIPKKIDGIVDTDFYSIKQFTLGIEHETCIGNIPWIDCLNTNLVPLYDGSINGHEYVTTPLKYSDFHIIKEHLKLLEYYTDFDEDCSLHLHFGNFPIEYNQIEKLCNGWKSFQFDLLRYLPAWSYYVERYKHNGKAYNKPLTILNLKNWMVDTTGNFYESDTDFYKVNRFDEAEEQKWLVKGRYTNMNIMRLIAGKKNKTVEFRFLRPTHNYSEIKWYILILGAFLKYVIEKHVNKSECISVVDVIDYIFPKELGSKLKLEGLKLMHLSKIQHSYWDQPGINTNRKEFYLSHVNFNI